MKFLNFLWRHKILTIFVLLVVLFILYQSKNDLLIKISKNIGTVFHVLGTVALVGGFLFFLKKKGTGGLSDIFKNFKFRIRR